MERDFIFLPFLLREIFSLRTISQSRDCPLSRSRDPCIRIAVDRASVPYPENSLAGGGSHAGETRPMPEVTGPCDSNHMAFVVLSMMFTAQKGSGAPMWGQPKGRRLRCGDSRLGCPAKPALNQ